MNDKEIQILKLLLERGRKIAWIDPHSQKVNYCKYVVMDNVDPPGDPAEPVVFFHDGAYASLDNCDAMSFVHPVPAL